MSATTEIEKDQTVFFPGCALPALAPAINDAVFLWLQEHDIASRQLSYCCGLPFKLQGYDELFSENTAKLYQFFKDEGIKKIVTACPNCYRALNVAAQELEQTITIEALPEVLVQEGMRINPEKAPEDTVFTIHDSCPDRKPLLFAHAVRELAKDLPVVEMKHNRKKTMCCGIGEPFYHAEPDVQQRQMNRRCEEALDVEANCIISACVNCTAALRLSETAVQSVHYLELLFDGQISQEPVEILHETLV